MKFVFNERKATQAAAHLLRRHGGSMSLLVFIKLLYLADRRSLIEAGHSLTGDWLVSMPHGPVVSNIYDLAKSNTHVFPSPWEDAIRRQGNAVVLEGDPGNDELSRYDRRVLDSVDAELGHLSPSALRAFTHKLPEWQDPWEAAGRGSVPIDPRTILRAGGRSEGEIAAIEDSADEELALHTAWELVSR